MISLRLNGTFVQSAPRRRSRRLRRREILFPLLSIAVTAVSVAALLTGFGLWALPAWTWHGILAWIAAGYLAAMAVRAGLLWSYRVGEWLAWQWEVRR